MELEPAVQTYDWGKVGRSSLVARFAEASASPSDSGSFVINEGNKYAELWMGTHPNGPCKMKEGGQSLLEFIQASPGLVLGDKVVERFGPDLPFLFKVLSVEKALSIQAHPDKELAQVLHASRGELYKDPNHKPEMAIALTPFQMMCGFRDINEILHFLQTVPELASIIGSDLISALASKRDKDALRDVYKKLMTTEEGTITFQLNEYLKRLESLDEVQRGIEGDLARRLAAQFPNDVGIWNVFFLQYFTLQPCQAVFLPANEPHAYIHGDCIECMAASDNVVRAGLTPKFKDVETLCSMLTYETGRDWVMGGTPIANGVGLLYDAPVGEFSVIRYKSDSAFSLKPHSDSCSILICVEGRGTALPQSGSSSSSNKSRTLSPGTVFFIPCQSEMSGMQVVPEQGQGPITIYEAFSTP